MRLGTVINRQISSQIILLQKLGGKYSDAWLKIPVFDAVKVKTHLKTKKQVSQIFQLL